uniref:Lipoprotein n=1 Tax=Strongyloides stercoralis TaxID=6248 RepID=A0A0K0ED09_STRER
MILKITFFSITLLNILIITSSCNFTIDSNEYNDTSENSKFNYGINKYEGKTTTVSTIVRNLKDAYKMIIDENKSFNEILNILSEAYFLTNNEDIKSNLLSLQSEIDKYYEEVKEKAKKIINKAENIKPKSSYYEKYYKNYKNSHNKVDKENSKNEIVEKGYEYNNNDYYDALISEAIGKMKINK